MTVITIATPDGPRRSDPEAVAGVEAEIAASLANVGADRSRLLAVAGAMPLERSVYAPPADSDPGRGAEFPPLRVVPTDNVIEFPRSRPDGDEGDELAAARARHVAQNVAILAATAANRADPDPDRRLTSAAAALRTPFPRTPLRRGTAPGTARIIRPARPHDDFPGGAA